MSTATAEKPRGPEITYGYFGNITKWEKLEDGTLMVFGKAAGSDLDLDEQICDEGWLKEQMPSWFEYGNVREQHGNTAAGVGKELTEADDGWYLKTHVVDPVTCLKVETGVLKGYSIGAQDGRIRKDAGARGGRIIAGKIHEISLVDRPANATCSISIAKSVGGTMTLVDAEPEPQVDAVDGPVILDDPNGPGLPPETIEKTATWYREALRTVEAVHAGQFDEAFAGRTIAKAAESEHQDVNEANIAGAIEAADRVLDLIIVEAGEAKGGRFAELEDIQVLLSAVHSLCRFVQRKQDHGGDGEKYDDIPRMAYKAAGSAWDEPDDDAGHGDAPMEDADARASATVDGDTTEMITKAVKAAQAEFTAAHEAEIATLRADLEKALAAPKPGGPVTFKTVQKTSSAPSQAATDPNSPAYWTALATDPNLTGEVQRAYLAKAASLSKGAST